MRSTSLPFWGFSDARAGAAVAGRDWAGGAGADARGPPGAGRDHGALLASHPAGSSMVTAGTSSQSALLADAAVAEEADAAAGDGGGALDVAAAAVILACSLACSLARCL